MIRLTILFISAILSAYDITPIPLEIEYDKNKANLGKRLFFDPVLSKDGSISCSSCHTLPGSGADSTPFSFGVNGAEGNINTPTVLNSVFNFVQFWNGRAKDLKEQALGPIENPIEMASDIEDVIKKLKSLTYAQDFKKIYKDGVTKENILDAIAEFEKALITPNSRFDQYIRGDENALNEQEKVGYQTFKDLGCISCHNGINIGSNMYQSMGLMGNYEQTKGVNGRFDITQRDRDIQVFKVPTLRNIELTGPYFHDGKISSLSEAIEYMQTIQLGVKPEKQNTDNIEAFLKTLTGEMPKIMKEQTE